MPKFLGITIPNPFAPLPRIWTNANRIRKIVMHSCAGFSALDITLAFAPLFGSIMLLFTPQPQQILQEYLRPKGSKARGKGVLVSKAIMAADRSGSPRKRYKRGMPYIDEIIAHRIPGRGFFAARTALRPERLLWLGIDFLDFLGWYWLLAHVTADFTLHWVSGIMENKFSSELCDSQAHFKRNNAAIENTLQWWANTNVLDISEQDDWLIVANGGMSHMSAPVYGPVFATGTLRQNLKTVAGDYPLWVSVTVTRPGKPTITIESEHHVFKPLEERKIELFFNLDGATQLKFNCNRSSIVPQPRMIDFEVNILGSSTPPT